MTPRLSPGVPLPRSGSRTQAHRHFVTPDQDMVDAVVPGLVRIARSGADPIEALTAREHSHPMSPRTATTGDGVCHVELDKRGTVTPCHQGRLHHIGVGTPCSDPSPVGTCSLGSCSIA